MKADVIVFLGHTATVVHIRERTDKIAYAINKILYNLHDYAWDRKAKRFVQDKTYYKLDRALGLIVIPKAYTKQLLEELNQNNIPFVLDKVEEVPSRTIPMEMQSHWVDKPEQIAPIKHMTSNSSSMKYIALQTGCLAGSNMIRFQVGRDLFSTTLREAYEQYNQKILKKGKRWNLDTVTQVRAYVGDKRIKFHELYEISFSGVKPVYRLTLENGLFVDCTRDHLIKVSSGWLVAEECLGKMVCHDNYKPGASTTRYSKAVFWEYLGEQPTYDIGCKAPHFNFTANDIVVHNSGKTYTSTKAAILLGEPFMVITSRLVTQWVKSVKEQTTLTDDEIFILKGSDSIEELIKKNIKPKCIIASLETMRNFCNSNNGSVSVDDLCYHVGIGTKIVDECHENFHAIVMIDLAMNIRNNIYLTATFIRNNPSTNKIFSEIFPKGERFGEDGYEQYADVKMYAYASYTPEKYVRMGGSYNHFKYESFLLKKESSLHWFCNHVLKRVIDERYIRIKKPGQRLLIIMGKRENIYKVVAKLRTIYKDLTIEAFTQDEGEDKLDADIIVSTPGSAGTGRHIHDLVSMICTISMEAPGKLMQLLGRLRKLKDSIVYYSDLYNEASKDHMRHKEAREKLFKKLAKTFSTGKL